jgi:hypothetical protein
VEIALIPLISYLGVDFFDHFGLQIGLLHKVLDTHWGPHILIVLIANELLGIAWRHLCRSGKFLLSGVLNLALQLRVGVSGLQKAINFPFLFDLIEKIRITFLPFLKQLLFQLITLFQIDLLILLSHLLKANVILWLPRIIDI